MKKKKSSFFTSIIKHLSEPEIQLPTQLRETTQDVKQSIHCSDSVSMLLSVAG